MDSDNPTGADNQQETKDALVLDAQWVVGFVDGEGCFSVAIHANPGAPHGWQLTPVFQVYQHEAHRAVLEGLQRFFDCGWIRSKGPGSSVLTYGVQSRSDLVASVIPFFEQHRPIVKADAFDAFTTIVRSLAAKTHLGREGLGHGAPCLRDERPGQAAQPADRARPRDPQRLYAEHVGQTDVMRQSEPHGDMWSQAEMSWPSETCSSLVCWSDRNATTLPKVIPACSRVLPLSAAMR